MPWFNSQQISSEDLEKKPAKESLEVDESSDSINNKDTRVVPVETSKPTQVTKSKDRLNEDLWINVATFLDPESISAIACVDKSWSTLTYDPTFWRVITTEQLRFQLSESVVDSLLACEDWSLIHTLDLSGTKITDVGLYVVARALSSVENVNLEGCVSITDSGIIQFAKRTGARLLDIDLSETNITDKSLKGLARFCHMLQAVSAKSCELTNTGLQYLSEERTGAVLRSLELGGCALVNDDGMKHLSKCPKLESVMIMGCDVTDTGVTHLADCESLQRLAACGFPGPITNKSAKALAKCKKLTDLILPASDINDMGLRMLAVGCPRLEHVFLADSMEITDAGLTSLAANCANLQSVDTSGCEKVMEPLSPPPILAGVM